jgi:Outer membrane protein beta-barrel domain
MKKILAILVLTVLVTIAGFAQQAATDDYAKFEVSATYSQALMKFKQYEKDNILRTNAALGNTFRKRDKSEKGVEFSAVANFSRYLGVKGSFSTNYNGRKGRINNQAFEVKERFNNYLVGVQIKDNNVGTDNRFRPFGYVMAGIANTKSSLKNCSAFGSVCPNSLNRSRKGAVGVIGGGLDIKITKNVSFRAIQADYQVGKVNEGFKVSTGIVFSF